MKTLHLILVLIFLFIIMSYKNPEINIQKTVSENDRVYVHTDRSSYFTGDTLWLSAYVLLAENLSPSYEANFLNVQLYDLQGKQILSQKHKLKGGKTEGFIHIADTLNAGDYLLIAYANTADAESLDGVFSKKIRFYKPDEQTAILEMDIGDTVYTKSTKVEGTIELRNGNGLRYADVDLNINLIQSDKIISTTKTNTGENGIKSFSIKIPEVSPGEAIYLKANSINSVLKTEEIILVPLKESPPDIQFLPESGRLLANHDNVIAFKGIDAGGNPFDFEADIVNREGQLIKHISSKYMGMGKFNLKYTDESPVYCVITKPSGYDKKYLLPKPEQNSYVLNITNTYKNKLIVSLNTNTASIDSIYLLKLSVRNTILLNEKYKLGELDSLTINTMAFPMGIAQVGVYDTSNKLLAERLVFINKNKKYPFRLIGLKKQYKPKSKVNILLNTMNRNYDTDPAIFSLSVSLISRNDFPEQEKNILSSLLLEKEIRGEIFTPGFYFSKNPFANKALDLLMLTQGWRKPIAGQSEQKMGKQLLAIQGRVVKLNGKPVKSATVSLINFKTFSIAKTTTDDHGHFSFKAIDYIMVADTNNLTVTATGPNDNKKVKILIDYPYQHKISNKIIEQDNKIKAITQLQTNEVLTKNKQNENTENSIEKKSNSELAKSDIEIKEVDVKANRSAVIPKEIYKKEFMVYELKEKDINLISGSNKETIFHLIQKAAGHFKVEDGGKILFRGNNSILLSRQQGAAIVIDGMFKGFDWRVLEYLSVYDIENIRVIKSPAAAMRYTSFALGGLIEVKTKNGFTTNKEQTAIHKASNLSSVNGFQPNRTYYSPKYTKNENMQVKFDQRKTIYWNPNIKPDKSGLTKISFFTSDITGKYLIKFEGVSKEGRVFYLVKNMLVVP